MEETTTDAVVQETGADYAQPEEQPAEAVQTPDSEPQQQDESEDTGEPAQPDNSSDDDISDYLSKKGIDLSTPEGQAALAKSYREAEKALSRKAQEASELRKSLVDQPVTVESDNPLVQSLAEEVVTMKRQQNIDQFVSEVNLSADQEAKLAEYISTSGKAELINGGYLTLKEAYQLSGVGNVDPSQYKKQGSQEALQQLANKQRATAPKGNASNNTLPQGLNKSNVESWYEGLGSEGRRDPANQAKLESILGS